MAISPLGIDDSADQADADPDKQQDEEIAGRSPFQLAMEQLRRELLPNLVAPIVVYFSLMVPQFVAVEAGLAYLGIGVVGTPSWGQTINEAVGYFDTYALYLWAPIIGILVLVVALNLVGDAVRDAFDPKTRR